MTTYIRGYNPVWLFDDLTGNLLDDNYYLFVLQNTLPYLPANVYHTNSGTTWTNPIQFLANGTLPVDIFFDPNVVYRLEVRHGNTQSDPLIYLIENYEPGTGGGSDINVDLTSENQVCNPQFAEIYFNSPFVAGSISTQNIDVGAGWVLELTGAGTLTLERQPLNNSTTTINSSNAPYALRILLAGAWTKAYLRQRFNQNGMLWANKTVSSAITARVEGVGVSISATLEDSNGTVLGGVLPSTDINGNFEEYTGNLLLPATSNPDLPPSAYIDYKLLLPNAVDIYVTSFQLIASDLEDFQPGFEQTSIDRQIDHTFHIYKDSILLQPKDSILTGWDFALNPWQSRLSTSQNVVGNEYTADQTIIVQQKYVEDATDENVAVSRGTFAENYAFKVTSVTNTNKFSMIQFIDAATVRPYWGNTVSALLKLKGVKKSAASTLRFKMQLIYKNGLPATLSQTTPIATWTDVSESVPTLAAGWTAILPKNNPVYDINNTLTSYSFDGFSLPVSLGDDMTLGIMFYLLDDMDAASTADAINFESCSLVPNEFAIEANPLTFNQTLQDCMYYYETSFPFGEVGTATEENQITTPMLSTSLVNSSIHAQSFNLAYREIKRVTPDITLYSGQSTTADRVYVVLRRTGAGSLTAEVPLTNWTIVGAGVKNTNYQANSAAALATTATAGTIVDAMMMYQYVLNARLGK